MHQISGSVACRLVVLISGSGSNLQAIIDACAADEIPGEIAGVISNRADAFGLERAARAGIATVVIDHRDFPDRATFDLALQQRVDELNPGLVVLAGFMRILSPGFVHHYAGRLINIHPSLLPKYPGLHTHQRAIDATDAEHGATVHFVTEELDGGPAIVQAMVPILADDGPDTLAARVLCYEHKIYPFAIRLFAEGRLRLVRNHAELDGTVLPPTGISFDS